MELQQSLPSSSNSIYNALLLILKLEQDLQTEIWFEEGLRPSKKDDSQSTLFKVTEVKNAIVRSILNDLPSSKVAMTFLPPNVSIDSLSITQKDALAMFVSQLDEEYNVVSNPDNYLLAGALNTLSVENNQISNYLFRQMLNKTPKPFLEGSEYI